MSATNEVVVKPAKPSKWWMFSCGLLCLAILIYGLAGERETSGGLAFQIGYNLPIAILIGGILHLVFRRREPPRTGWIGLLLVYVALVVSSVLSTNRERHEFKTAANEIERTVTLATSTNVSQPSAPATPSAAPVASGDAGKLETAVKTIVNRSLAQRREYELELEAIGWSRILDGERIRKDMSLAESRTILRQARDIVSKYRGQTDELFAQVRHDIETAGLKPEAQRAAIAGFDKNAGQGKAQAAELWSLEEETLSQVENIFTLLAAKRNSWHVQQNQIVFNDQSDLDLFNSYLSRINQIMAQQQALQTAGVRRTQEKLRQLSQ